MNPENHFFVCGPGHSGTTLMLAIIDSHPEIGAIPHETGIFHRIRDDEELLAVVKAWPKARSISEKFIAEKTPVHARYLDRIFSLLPDARIILMVRDGRDASLSEAKRLGDFAMAAKQWARTITLSLPFVGDTRVRMVKYENLVTRPEVEIPAVCEFLGVEFDPRMLQHDTVERKWWDTEVRPANHESPLVGENHKRNRNWQINQPMFDASGKWRSQMTPEQVKLFKDIAGDLLIALGYEQDLQWTVAPS